MKLNFNLVIQLFKSKYCFINRLFLNQRFIIKNHGFYYYMRNYNNKSIFDAKLE